MVRLRRSGLNGPGWRAAWRCGKEGEGDKGVEAGKEVQRAERKSASFRSINLFYQSSSSLHQMEMNISD